MKPTPLEPLYASQYSSVVHAYRFRPPYPSAVFDILDDIQPHAPRIILEVGCGSGDLTLGLQTRADRIDAVEPSPAMLVMRGHNAKFGI